MKSKSAEKIKFMTVDELLGVPAGETAEEIDIDKVYEFKNHPFKVIDDASMHELEESILENGILTPVIVRLDEEGNYEMISGHRRLYAAKKVGLETIPAFVREMDDELAVIAMVDSNLQREKILPSEKAKAYKMRYEAMRKQGNRCDLTWSQVGTKLKKSSQVGRNIRADEALAEQVGESRNQVHRFLRIAELIPELLELVDKDCIAIQTGVDISYLDAKMQRWIYEYAKENGVVMSYQVKELRRVLLENEEMTQKEMIELFNNNLPTRLPSHRVSFTGKKMHEYFPAYYTEQEMRDVILDLLAKWKKENGGK